jgi:glycosyltransferase involved in cell wall biosynthesis
VRNGEPWLRQKLKSICELEYPRHLLQILVISDGSTDQTDGIATEFASEGVRLLRIEQSGKAVAINHGLEQATGEIVFFTDVRQNLEPNSLRFLVECFEDATVGVVSGELVIVDGANREQANVGLYWKYEKWIRNHLSQLDSVLGATGCIYAIRRSLAVPLPAGVLLDDVYEPMAAFFRGYRAVLDMRAKAYDYPTALSSEFRRKVRTLAGVFQIIRCYPRLILPSNRMWFHFMSYKLGRLLLPYALLTVAASSFLLPSPLRECALAGQIGFYTLALIDRWVPERSKLKRLSSPICVFVVLMAAAICAASILFRSSESLWKKTDVGAPAGHMGVVA